MVLVCDETGTPIGMRGVMLDIAERKQAERKGPQKSLEQGHIGRRLWQNHHHLAPKPGEKKMNKLQCELASAVSGEPTRF